MRDVLWTQTDPKEVFLALTVDDVRAVCDVLRTVFETDVSGMTVGVSLEVDPRLAQDMDATVTEAARLNRLVDRPNLMVKIPANVTLLFSLDRHRAAAEASAPTRPRRR